MRLLGFCRHNYQLMDKTVLASALEQAQTDAARKDLVSLVGQMSGPPNWIGMKMVVLTLKCNQCGKLKILARTHRAR